MRSSVEKKVFAFLNGIGYVHFNLLLFSIKSLQFSGGEKKNLIKKFINYGKFTAENVITVCLSYFLSTI